MKSRNLAGFYVTSYILKSMTNDEVLLNLVACQDFGPQTIRRLEKYFPHLEDIFKASRQLLRSAGLSERLINKFINWRQSSPNNKPLEILQRENIGYLSWNDSNYPQSLKEIPSPPPIIFYKGNLSLLKRPHRLAIVGSRRPTPYAEKILKEFLPILTNQEIVIISGLALGVDSLAHANTLANNGATIAVLGSGLKKNVVYPATNRKLLQNIINNGGLIISEFGPSEPAKKMNFPRRNRIISGLAEAVLIVEAAKKSGSLITARYALEQNREVLAIPGNIFLELSEGTNNLIKDGAGVVVKAADILDYLKISFDENSKTNQSAKKTKYLPINETERLIYCSITVAEERGESLSLDEISQKTKLDTATINSTLSILEIKNVIVNRDGYFNLSL